MTRITNAKQLGLSNKSNILFKLQNEGGKSRLQLAKSLNLTASSITQLVKDLIDKGFVVEKGSVQRNVTGRRETLLDINSARFAAIGVNIEKDNTHISVCNYNKVIEERIFNTDKILPDKGVTNLVKEIKDIYAKHCDSVEIMGLGLGIIGQVDKERGIAINSHGIFSDNYPLQNVLAQQMDIDIRIINNVRAQARALISARDDNFMYVKHSPGIGCAIVVGGKIVEGYNAVAGELGHTVVKKNGELCLCGRRGCLETVVAEKAIEKRYLSRAGQQKNIAEIYEVYGTDSAATEILNDCIYTLALAIGNAATINDPKKVMVTGGMFFQKKLQSVFDRQFDELGFGKCYKIIKVDNDKQIKAYAGARHILLEKLFEV